MELSQEPVLENKTFLMDDSAHFYVKSRVSPGVIDMENVNFSLYDVANVTQSVTDITINNMSNYLNYLKRKKEFEEQVRQTLFHHYDNPVVIVLVILYALTFACGLPGNLSVIYIFNMRKMRSPTNTFLVNLAICDLTVVLVCMPFTAMQAVYSDWIYGNAWCKLMNYFQGVSIFASILTLTVISADRFYVVRHPLQARSFVTHARAVKIIVALYVVTASVMIPALIVRYEQESEPVIPILSVTIRTCEEHWPSIVLKHTYNFALVAILYVGPIIFISVGYLRIGSDLWREDSALHATTQNVTRSGNSVARHLLERRKVARMLFIIAVLFALSWLPFNVLLVTVDFLPFNVIKENGQLVRYVYDFALWLGHANSAVNPICYCIMSQSFKRAFKLEFKRCCCCCGSAGSGRRRVNRRESVVSRSNSLTVTTTYGRAKQTSCIHKTSMAAYNLINLTRGTDQNGDVTATATATERKVANTKL